MAGRELEGSDGRRMGSDGKGMDGPDERQRVRTAGEGFGQQGDGSDGRDRGNGEYPPSVQASLLLLF